MKLGLSSIGMDLSAGPLRDLGQKAEALGYDSIWTSEAWRAGPIETLIVEPTGEDAMEKIASLW